MISSNTINIRNLVSKKLLINGLISTQTTYNIDVKKSTFIELDLISSVINSASYVLVRRTGGITNDVDSPRVYEENGGSPRNNTFFFNMLGKRKIYVDTNGYDSITIVVSNGTASSDYANIKLYATALTIGKNELLQRFDTIKGRSSLMWIGIDPGNILTGSTSRVMNVKDYRYAIFESSVFASSTTAFINISVRDVYDVVKYPTIRNLKTNEIVSYGNSQIRLLTTGVNKYYIDLMELNSDKLIINISNNSADLNVKANFALIDLTNEMPFNQSSEVAIEDDVLLEGDNFRFVKKALMQDAYNGNFLSVNTASSLVYYSDDVENPNKNVLNLSSIRATEGIDIRSAHIIPYDPAKKVTLVAFRVMVIFKNNSTYVNYYNGGDVNTWGKVKAWEMRSTRRKIPVDNIANVNANSRYNPTFTPARYLRNLTTIVNGTTYIQYQGDFKPVWLGDLCRTKKQVSWGSYYTDGDRVGIWSTTDGGENWVLQYDFINKYISGESVNTNAMSAYTGGLNLQKVNIKYPSLADKNPTNIFTYTNIGSVSSITKGAETVINYTSHGLIDGDIVILTGTGQDADWSSLLCDSFNNFGFSESAYSVQKINDNSFRIKQYNGSYDTTLQARHIHSINEHVGGTIASTGEEYPDGWFIYLGQKYKDSAFVVDAFVTSNRNVFRLNSASEGIQRACGFIMGNEPDPTIIFNCDTSNPKIGRYQIDGRTDTTLPPIPTNGVWKGKLSKIDNWKDFECILPIGEPAIWMHNIGDVIVSYYQLGANAVSVDGGNTWNVFPIGTSKINGVYNNSIVIGDGYVFEWK